MANKKVNKFKLNVRKSTKGNIETVMKGIEKKGKLETVKKGIILTSAIKSPLPPFPHLYKPW